MYREWVRRELGQGQGEILEAYSCNAGVKGAGQPAEGVVGEGCKGDDKGGVSLLV